MSPNCKSDSSLEFRISIMKKIIREQNRIIKKQEDEINRLDAIVARNAAKGKPACNILDFQETPKIQKESRK